MTISLLKNNKFYDNKMYSLFLLGPFSTGGSLFIANTLTQILTRHLIGTAITAFSFKINESLNRFKPNGIYEDIFELSSNLTQVVFCSKYHLEPIYGSICVVGPCIVTASDIKAPITIVNKNQYICTIVSDEKIEIKVRIETSKGVFFADEANIDNENFIPVNAFFNPVFKTNFKVKLDFTKNPKIYSEYILYEIWTNGAITPQRALLESLKLSIQAFSELFMGINNGVITTSD